jgi:hypothetical protein
MGRSVVMPSAHQSKSLSDFNFVKILSLRFLYHLFRGIIFCSLNDVLSRVVNLDRPQSSRRHDNSDYEGGVAERASQCAHLSWCYQTG